MALFPEFTFSEDDIYMRWGQRYISEGFDKKFLGFPIGIHKGFTPEVDTVDPGNKINLNVDATQGYSMLKVKATSDNIMLDVYTEDNITLDFQSHIFGTSIYVVARGGYTVGSTSTAEIITQNAPGDGLTEVTICRVEKIAGLLQVFFADIPADRHLPTAHAVADFGYMTSGAQEQLDTAVLVRTEIIAARADLDTGFIHPDLSARLTQDYGTVDNRLAKALDLVQGNVHALAAPAFSMSIADSLSSGTRTFEPIIDIDPNGLPGIGVADDGVISASPDNVVPLINSDTGRKIYDTGDNPVYGRFTAPDVLSFHSLVSGVETAFDFTGLTPINIKPFLPVFLPLTTDRQDATLKLLKSYVNDPPPASETSYGVAEFAPDGGVVGLTAVQGNDTRLVDICKTDGSTNFSVTQSYTGPVVIGSNNDIPDKDYVDGLSITTNASVILGPFGNTGGAASLMHTFAFDVKTVGVTFSLFSDPTVTTPEGFRIIDVSVSGTDVTVDYEVSAIDFTVSFLIMAGGN